MKKLIGSLFTILSLNAFAIQFITEAQVGEKLEAEKVIEISKYSVEALVESTPCAAPFASRSARAYVVKKDNKAALYLTEEGLDQLTKCKDL